MLKTEYFSSSGCSCLHVIDFKRRLFPSALYNADGFKAAAQK